MDEPSLEFVHRSCLWNIFSLFHHTETYAKKCLKIKILISSSFFFLRELTRLKLNLVDDGSEQIQLLFEVRLGTFLLL